MSAGYKVLPGGDGTQIPVYNTYPNVMCQIQPLSTSDLQHTDGLNLQAINKSLYLNGNVEGVDRAAIKGGNTFTTPDNKIWLVTQVIEHWPDWSHLVITLQVKR